MGQAGGAFEPHCDAVSPFVTVAIWVTAIIPVGKSLVSGSEKPTTFWQSIACRLGNVVFALPNLKAMLVTADPLYWAFCHALNALLRVAEGVLPAFSTTFDGVLVKFSSKLSLDPCRATSRPRTSRRWFRRSRIPWPAAPRPKALRRSPRQPATISCGSILSASLSPPSPHI